MVVPSARLTLLSKPGCHLCDAARDVVTGVVAELGASASGGPIITVEEKSILDDPELNDRYWDEIPVVLIDDVVHNIWKIDPDRLRAALVEAIA